MKRWNAPLSVVFVLCLMSAAIVDAEVVGVIHEGTGDTEHLARIDPSTGSLSLLPGIANCCFVASGVSAVDEAGARLFFVGRIMNDPGETDNRIFTVDINTGAVLSNPTLTTGYNYNFLEFDPSSGTLYAVAYNADLASSSGGTTKQEELLTINTTTGAATTVGSGIDQCCWVSSGASAIDSAGGTMFFLGAKFTDSSSQRRIFSVDLATGAATADPLVDGGSTDYNYNFLGRDNSGDTIYAVAYNSGLASSSGGTTKQEELLTVNTATGAVSTVGSGIDQCCWVSSGSSGFDSRNGVFYFLGAKFTDSSSQRRLFSVDASTGSVLDSPLVDGGSTTYNHNFMEFSETVIFSDGLENGQSDEWSATVP